MKRVFEIFYRKRIALSTAPLQREIDELRANLAYANEIVKSVKQQNDELLARVDALNAELDEATKGNGLTRSQYITVRVPNPIVDSENNPLRGEYMGHQVDYELVYKAREGLLILRSDRPDAGKIDLEVVGSGVVEIIINQRMDVAGRTSVSYNPFALFEVDPGVHEYELQDFYSVSLSRMLEQARMTVNNISADS